MSQWGDAYHDPTGDHAVPEEALIYLTSHIEKLSPIEASVIRMRFGLIDGQTRSYGEIAAAHGLEKASDAESIEFWARLKLRRESGEKLRSFRHQELTWIPEHIRARVTGEPSRLPPLILCDKHGWIDPVGVSPPFYRPCEQCPCFVATNFGRVGRPGKYCSNACRQAASRQRKGNKNN